MKLSINHIVGLVHKHLFRIILPVSIFSSKPGQLAIRWNSSQQNRPTPRDSSRKFTNIALREQGTFFQRPREKKPDKVLKKTVLFSGTIIVGQSITAVAVVSWSEISNARIIPVYIYTSTRGALPQPCAFPPRRDVTYACTNSSPDVIYMPPSSHATRLKCCSGAAGRADRLPGIYLLLRVSHAAQTPYDPRAYGAGDAR